MRAQDQPRGSAAAAAPAAPAHPDAEADRVFCKHTIAEIRVIEKRIRGDIERKKEELRQMVGERYRDLIGAADSIMAMNVASSEIIEGIERMDTLCRQAGRMRADDAAPSADKRGPRTRAFYSAATQMKLLVDTPEQIWSALERREFLRASQLYLIAEHMFANIGVEDVGVADSAETQRGALLAAFPILNRQWAAIGHFRDPILQEARGELAAEGVNDESLADAACAVVLLDDRPPKEVLSEYLSARTALVRNLLRPEGIASSTAKEQLCRVARIVKDTLHSAFVIFFAGGASDGAFPSGALARSLHHVTSADDGADAPYIARLFTGGSMHAIVRNLPQSVQRFRPTAPLSVGSNPAKMRAACQALVADWLATASAVVAEGAAAALKGLDTIKSLRSLADAVWETLGGAGKEDAGSEWDAMCAALLGHPVALYDHLFRKHVIARAKDILDVAFAGLAHVPRDMVLSDAASDDVGAWVWSDEPDQMAIDQNSGGVTGGYSLAAPPGGVGVGAGAGGLVAAVDLSNQLALKAIALTPFVRDVCVAFDASLGSILDDASHAFGSEEVHEKNGHVAGAPQPEQPRRGPFDHREDGSDIRAHVRTLCHQCILSVCSELSQLHELSKSVIEETGSGNTRSENGAAASSGASAKVLLVGRTALAIAQHCRSLQEAMRSGDAEVQREGGLLRRMSSGPRTPVLRTGPLSRQSSFAGAKPEFDARLEEGRKALRALHAACHHTWAVHLARSLGSALERGLAAENWSDPVVSRGAWEDIRIQEESEGGDKVDSVVRLPAHLSRPALAFVHDLCVALNQCGAHALDRPIVLDAVQLAADEALAIFERFAAGAAASQEGCVQMLFDTRLLFDFLSARLLPQCQPQLVDFAGRRDRLVALWTSRIDPFDMDVFAPHIRSNVVKAYQRSSVLFGTVAGLNRLYSDQKRGMQSHESHGPLAIAPVAPRFALLPISASIAAPVKPPSWQQQTRGGPKAAMHARSQSGPAKAGQGTRATGLFGGTGLF